MRERCQGKFGEGRFVGLITFEGEKSERKEYGRFVKRITCFGEKSEMCVRGRSVELLTC